MTQTWLWPSWPSPDLHLTFTGPGPGPELDKRPKNGLKMSWFGMVWFGMARMWSKLVWYENIPAAPCIVSLKFLQNSWKSDFQICDFGKFEKKFVYCHDPGSQPSHIKPNHTNPRHFWPIFRPFWPSFWAKVPKSKWIWFEDTYPLNQWVVLSWKILVSPFDQFEKYLFGSADMCHPDFQWGANMNNVDPKNCLRRFGYFSLRGG